MNRLRSLSNTIQDHLLPSEKDSGDFAPFPRPSNPEGHLLYALEIAKESTAKPTNFSVGAVVVEEVENHILVTGYTNELPGNTHAEECALQKLKKKNHVNPSQWLSPDASGNIPCTETILNYNLDSPTRAITKVYYGVQEPEMFVEANTGQAKLQAAGVQMQFVPGLDKEIMEIATAGHRAVHNTEPS